MSHRIRIIAVLSALSAFRAVGAQRPSADLSPPRAALWNEIRAVNDSMEAAFNRGDLIGVARFYTDDAKLAGGGGSVVEGRAAIDRYWTNMAKPKQWKLEVIAVGGSSALAYQSGRSRLTTTGANGQEHTSVVDFVVIWRRQPNGALRIAMDLY